MLEKMNVANFIKQNKQLERDDNEYQKAINRQGSKKLIQGNFMNPASQFSGGGKFM